jgi:hypothetical protein
MPRQRRPRGQAPGGHAGKNGADWRKPAGQVFDIVSQRSLASLKKRLGLNTEIHNFYDLSTATAVTSIASGWTKVPTVGDCPVIATGNTNLTRVGDSIRITKIVWKFGVSSLLTSAYGARVRLILAKQTLGPAATGGSNLSANSGLVMQNNTVFDSQYAAQMEDSGINIVMDRVVQLSLAASGSTPSVTWEFEQKGFHMKWNTSDTAGSIADVTMGDLALWACYDNGPGTITGAPVLSVTRRVEFVDN